MTTIRSRIGPVLDPVGIRSDATRRRGTAPGGVLRRRRPTCALLGRCARAGRRRPPGRHVGVGGREHGRSRRSPPIAAARTGGTLRFVEGAIPPLPAVGIRLWRKFGRSGSRSDFEARYPHLVPPSGRPFRVTISANDASGRFSASSCRRSHLNPSPWLVLPGWARRCSSSVPSPRGCYAGAAAKRAFGSASWRPLRELIPSLLNTLRRCHSTVRALM